MSLATDVPVPGTGSGPGTPAAAPVREPGLRELVGVVTQRELLVKLRDKTFIGSTIFLLLIVAVSIVLPALLDRGNPDVRLASVGDRAATVAAAAARLGALADGDTPGAAQGLAPARIQPRALPDAEAARAAVRAGTVDAALVPDAAAPGGLALVGDTALPEPLAPLVGAAAREQTLGSRLQAAGLDAAAAGAALTAAAGSTPAQHLLDPPAQDANLSLALSLAFSMLFFFASFLFGMSIAQSVVEEKQSRVVEILVAAVPVRALLAGKVAANTVLALGQTVLLGAVGMIGAGLVGQGDVLSLILRSTGWFLVFFVLGFTMLATLWAACGAVASRLEDLNATTVPMQLLLYLPFFAAVYVHDPGTLQRILSYVPFTAPLAMPQRLMTGDAAWWEALISAAIVVVTAVGVVGIATRLYERNVLRTAGRVPWREAWNA